MNVIKSNNKKPQVAIYVRSSEEYIANGGTTEKEQEEKLRKYCKKKGYKIIRIFRDTNCEDTCWYFAPKIMDLLLGLPKSEYEIVLAIDIDRFSRYVNKVFLFYEFLNEFDIELETLADGVIGKDFLFGVTNHSNVMNKSELEMKGTNENGN